MASAWLPSPAMVLACVALAASTGAFAFAGPLSKGVTDDSVKSQHIVDGEVRAADLAADAANTEELQGGGPFNQPGAVRSRDVLNQDLGNADLADAAVTGFEVAEESLGAHEFNLDGVFARKAYSDHGSDIELTDSNSKRIVASVDVPRGDYLIFARVGAVNTDFTVIGDDSALFGCKILTPHTANIDALAEGEENLTDRLGEGPTATFGLQAVYEADDDTTFNLRCAHFGHSEALGVRDARIIAMRLDAVR